MDLAWPCIFVGFLGLGFVVVVVVVWGEVVFCLFVCF